MQWPGVSPRERVASWLVGYSAAVCIVLTRDNDDTGALNLARRWRVSRSINLRIASFSLLLILLPLSPRPASIRPAVSSYELTHAKGIMRAVDERVRVTHDRDGVLVNGETASVESRSAGRAASL